MTAAEHDLALTHSPSGGWSAGCSCGWEWNRYGDESAAVDAWENHCDVVFMEATGG